MSKPITEQMRSYIEARRDFLISNRPKCPGVMDGRAPICTGIASARLIEAVTPAQWACAECKRTWQSEPVPHDEA